MTCFDAEAQTQHEARLECVKGWLLFPVSGFFAPYMLADADGRCAEHDVKEGDLAWFWPLREPCFETVVSAAREDSCFLRQGRGMRLDTGLNRWETKFEPSSFRKSRRTWSHGAGTSLHHDLTHQE